MLSKHFTKLREPIWHILLLVIGVYFVLQSHIGLDLSWLNSDSLMTESFVHSAVYEHSSPLLWVLPPCTHLIATPVIFIASMFTENSHYWILASIIVKCIWLYSATIWLFHLIKPSEQRRYYAGVLVFCFFILASILFVKRHDPMGFFWPLVSDGGIAYADMIMPLTSLCLCLSHMSSPQRLKLIFLGLICFFSAFSAVLFLCAFTVPFIFTSRFTRLSGFVLLTSLAGFLSFTALKIIDPLLTSLPLIIQPLSNVLHFLAQPFEVNFFLGLAHYGAIIVLLVRYFCFSTSLSKKQKLVYQFFFALSIITVCSMFLDHDLTHSNYYSRFHYQFFWYLPFVLVIDAIPVWLSMCCAVCLGISTYPFWPAQPHYSVFFKPSSDVLCLQKIIQHEHLHSGLSKYWLTAPLQLQSNWQFSLANFGSNNINRYTYADTLDHSRNKQFDYVITASSMPAFTFDDEQAFKKEIGPPDAQFSCPHLKGYIYRHHQLKGYSWHA